MDISQNIKKLRESKRLSQSEVARRMEVAPEFYHRLEKRGNKLTFEQVERIARALEASISEVVFFGQQEVPLTQADFDYNVDVKRKARGLLKLTEKQIEGFQSVIRGYDNFHNELRKLAEEEDCRKLRVMIKVYFSGVDQGKKRLEALSSDIGEVMKDQDSAQEVWDFIREVYGEINLENEKSPESEQEHI